MKFPCSITRLANGDWSVRHEGAMLGHVEAAARSRPEALEKMRGEILYRLEICPCTGESYQHTDIELVDVTTSNPRDTED